MLESRAFRHTKQMSVSLSYSVSVFPSSLPLSAWGMCVPVCVCMGLYVYVHAHSVAVHMWGPEETLRELVLFSPHEFYGSSSDCQVWWEVPTVPSRQPIKVISSIILILIAYLKDDVSSLSNYILIGFFSQNILKR